MKHLLYFLFGFLLLASCSKDKKDDPTPKSPAESVAGLYTMTSITSSGQTVNLPFTNPSTGANISGTINVVVVPAKTDEANMTITLKITGTADTVGEGPVQVKAAAKGYELFDNGQKVGTVQDNTLTLTEGTDVIVAKK